MEGCHHSIRCGYRGHGGNSFPLEHLELKLQEILDILKLENSKLESPDMAIARQK
jgi:hypothetical protein